MKITKDEDQNEACSPKATQKWSKYIIRHLSCLGIFNLVFYPFFFNLVTFSMPRLLKALSTRTHALRRNGALLEQLQVDPSKVRERSQVFQRDFHQDHKWSNILVRMNGEVVELFWIDWPKGYFSSFSSRQKHARLKDCATLDKLARQHCTPEERRRFVATYLEQPIDAPEVVAFSKSIARYRCKRFDAQDNRQIAEANAAKQK
jgi:hypothetical protein